MDYFAPVGQKTPMVDLKPGDIVELVATRNPPNKTITVVHSVSTDGPPSLMNDRFQRFYEQDRTAYLLRRPLPEEPTNIGAMVRVFRSDGKAYYYVRGRRLARPWLSLQEGALIYFDWDDFASHANNIEIIYIGYEEKN